MKLVIDIDERAYSAIRKRFGEPNRDNNEFFWIETVRNGTLLSDVLANIRSDIWDAGVNMAGEYQGVWTRFHDVEKAFDKQMEKNE